MDRTNWIGGLAFVATLLGCGSPTSPKRPQVRGETAPGELALPGASGPVTVDFIAYERERDRVWIPVGETGSVDVFDIASRTFTRVDGFKTQEREVRGRKRTMGPSSVTFGEGVAFVGNRASNEVCAIDTATLHLGACVTLDSAPDAVAYVATSREVWATTPKEHSITIVDATSSPRVKGKIQTAGEAEGYAVHGGTFFTNYEDKNVTVAINVASHAIESTWPLQCSDGPRGLVATDTLVIVACTNELEALDTRQTGRVVGKLDVGDGVDIIDIAGDRVYAAASKAARLTVGHVDATGALTAVETITTQEGVRNAVVDTRGRVYAVEPSRGALLVFTPSSAR